MLQSNNVRRFIGNKHHHKIEARSEILVIFATQLIDVCAHRWLGFTIAGAAAGLAGGLYAFSKGSIDPTLLGIPLSVDFLAMILLGGMQTVMGPVLGAAAFHSIKDVFMPLTDHWRFLLGASIIALVLIFPRGLGGAYAALRARLSGGAP